MTPAELEAIDRILWAFQKKAPGKTFALFGAARQTIRERFKK